MGEAWHCARRELMPQDAEMQARGARASMDSTFDAAAMRGSSILWQARLPAHSEGLSDMLSIKRSSCTVACFSDVGLAPHATARVVRAPHQCSGVVDNGRAY